MAVPQKYAHIDFVPTRAMRQEAERGLDWRSLYGRGGTAVGIARARDIANGRTLSPETVKRMSSYFARHEVDKEAEGFRVGEPGYPSNGRIAWALWGGDPGASWANMRMRQMERADEEEKKEPSMANKIHQYKSFPVELKAMDEETGIVEAIVAVMGNIDLGNDVIHPGAFTKTINERGHKIKVLDNHNSSSVSSVIGRPLEIREIGREDLSEDLLAAYPDATGGLYTKTQYLIDTPEGVGAFRRIAAGVVDEYSIGYDVIKADYDTVKRAGKSTEVRNLREIALWEYSPVVFAMNPATATVSAKEKLSRDVLAQIEREIGDDIDASWSINIMISRKMAVSPQDFPLAPRDMEWDGTGAEGRWRDWAGGGEDIANMDWQQYRRGFVWYDAENTEQIGSYKLGIADIVEGEPMIVPRGVFAASAAVMGARGGVDISQSDMDEVKSTLVEYYMRMAREYDDDSIVAPWDKSKDTRDSKQDTSIAEKISEAMRMLHEALMEAGLLQASEDDAEEQPMTVEEVDNATGAEPNNSLTLREPEKMSSLARERLERIQQIEKELSIINGVQQ
jgi:HK97 family phage prohead protease